VVYIKGKGAKGNVSKEKQGGKRSITGIYDWGGREIGYPGSDSQVDIREHGKILTNVEKKKKTKQEDQGGERRYSHVLKHTKEI